MNIIFTPKYQTTNSKNIASKGKASQILKPGKLTKNTSIEAESVIRAYQEIISKLACKTKEGLLILQEKYPAISIGSSLIFHNCGENKVSISINRSKTDKYEELTYITCRKGSGNTDSRILLDSYLLEGCDKLVKTTSGNHTNQFMSTGEYESQKEIDTNQRDNSLHHLLDDLGFAMLSFRKFLNKNMNEHIKIPDGEIPYYIVKSINESFNTINEIKNIKLQLSDKRVEKSLNGFEGYVVKSGSSDIIFENLGEEKVKINLFNVNSKRGENLKRLTVYNEEGKPFESFLIVNDTKIVANINPSYPNNLPDKFIYANKEEMNKEFLPKLQHYHELYSNKLNDFQQYWQDILNEYQKIQPTGNFSTEVQKIFNDIINLLDSIKLKVKRIPYSKAEEIRTSSDCVRPIAANKALGLKEDDKIVDFFPIKNNKFSNLVRVTISDKKTNESKIYLIHEGKYIVSNYNPNYPCYIPPELKYMNESDFEKTNLQPEFLFFLNKLQTLDKNFDNAINTFKDIKVKKKKGIDKTKIVNKPEFKILTKECQLLLKTAMENIDNGITDFNSSIAEIQKKFTDFYLKHKH